jgi:hypothetical protein
LEKAGADSLAAAGMADAVGAATMADVVVAEKGC